MGFLATLDQVVYNFGWGRYFYRYFLPKGFEFFARFILRYYAPLSVKGRENLPDGPFILISNHHSHIDTTVLLVGTGKNFSDFGIMAAHDYFFEKKNIARYLLNLLPIERNSKAKNDFSKMIKFLHVWEKFNRNNKKSIIMFPEGTRTPSGAIKPFKPGVGELAYTLNLPVVPCYIKGSETVLKKGKRFLYPGCISLKIGKAHYPSVDQLGTRCDKKKIYYEDFAKKLHDSVVSLSIG